MHTLRNLASGLILSCALAGCEGTSVLGKSNQSATPHDDAGSDPGTGGISGDGGSAGSGDGGSAGNGGDGSGGSNSGSSGSGSGGGGEDGSPGPACTTTNQCIIFFPNCSPCDDGTTRCPHYECIQGSCVIVEPPEPPCAPPIHCDTANECPITDATCDVCADGSQSCPHYACESHRCVIKQPECPTIACSDSGGCQLPNLPICRACADGAHTTCAHNTCEANVCVVHWTSCSPECDGKSCGDECFPPCTDNAACTQTFCDATGQCVAHQVDCR